MTDKIESINQDFLEDIRKTAEDFLNELDLEADNEIICRVCKHGARDGSHGICEECMREHGLL